jgi:redox-sensitive bicupin YhaK (pirin superfamily)
MSAGTGVQHSEFNHSQTKELHFLQMWVLPGRLGGKPLYGQVEFNVDERLGRWLVVASGQSGVEARVRLTQDASFRVSRLADGQLHHVYNPGRLGFLFVAEGNVTAVGVDGNGMNIGAEAVLAAGDAVRMSGVTRLKLDGTGEVVLWDVPRLTDGANDE